MRPYKEFKIFGFQQWLWFLLCLGVVGLFSKAVTYNHGHLPVGAWVSSLVTIGAFYGITARFFWLRYKFKKRILYYTRQGTAIVTDRKGILTNKLLDVQFSAQIATAIDEAANFWAGVFKERGTIDYALKNLSTLTFDTEVLVWHGMGENTRGMTKRALGLTQGNQMSVGWLVGRGSSELLGLIKHEMGHLALYALGIVDWSRSTDDENHHAIMRREGFNF